MLQLVASLPIHIYALHFTCSILHPWTLSAVCWPVCHRVCFSRVREAAGLDRCHVQVVGAAPIAKNVLEFFLDFDIPIYEIYGMSESSGPQTVSHDGGLAEMKYIRMCTFTHAFTHIQTYICTYAQSPLLHMGQF